MRTIQLRDYTIRSGELERFAALWAQGVRPLREQKGFHVVGAWRVPEQSRFVWIVSYDGPAGWEAANKAYYDSPERKALDPDPATLILEQRTAFIEPV